MNLWKSLSELLDDSYAQYGKVGLSAGPEKSVAQNLFRKIVDRACRDFTFRNRLLNAPVEVLSQEGFILPEGFGMKFVEETENTIYIPIPPYMEEAVEGEETDEDLLRQVVHRSVTDRAFRCHLVEAPCDVLMARGFTIPLDKKVVILENSDDLFYVILPLFKHEKAVDVTDFHFAIDGKTVTIKGRLDSFNVSRIREKLLNWTGKDMDVELRDVTFISSAGLALFLAVRKQLLKSGGVIRILNLRPAVRNVFILGGFEEVFRV